MATITDIAKATNLSIATVSRVLSYDQTLSVTAETRQKIFETAETLQYTKYKKKKSKLTPKCTIIVLQWRSLTEELDDIYFFSIRIGVERRANELGIQLIYATMEDTDMIKKSSGILAIGKFDLQTIQTMCSLHTNICILGTNYPLDGFSAINGDFAQASIQALDYLFKLGHQKIGYIGTEETENLYGFRSYKTPSLNAYIDYLTSKNLFDQNLLFVERSPSGNLASIGEQLMQEAIDSLNKEQFPSAFLVANDAMVLGCMDVFQRNNIRVPQDISLVGINDLSISQYISPPLTSVKIFTEDMGAIGIDLLANQIKHKSSMDQRIMLASKLIIRESASFLKK